MVKNYLSVVYDEESHPYTDYPKQLCAFISPFIPVRTKNKFFRWSRELMLVGIGMKSS